MRILDKMVAGMECCREGDSCSKCPYYQNGDEIGCIQEMNTDILKYLKDHQKFIEWMETLDKERKG